MWCPKDWQDFCLFCPVSTHPQSAFTVPEQYMLSISNFHLPRAGYVTSTPPYRQPPRDSMKPSVRLLGLLQCSYWGESSFHRPCPPHCSQTEIRQCTKRDRGTFFLMSSTNVSLPTMALKPLVMANLVLMKVRRDDWTNQGLDYTTPPPPCTCAHTQSESTPRSFPLELNQERIYSSRSL